MQGWKNLLIPCDKFTFSRKLVRTAVKSSAIFVWFYFQHTELTLVFLSLDADGVTSPAVGMFHQFQDKSHSKREYHRILNVLSQTLTSEPVAPFTATNGDIHLFGSTCTAPEGVFQQGAQ